MLIIGENKKKISRETLKKHLKALDGIFENTLSRTLHATAFSLPLNSVNQWRKKNKTTRITSVRLIGCYMPCTLPMFSLFLFTKKFYRSLVPMQKKKTKLINLRFRTLRNWFVFSCFSSNSENSHTVNEMNLIFCSTFGDRCCCRSSARQSTDQVSWFIERYRSNERVSRYTRSQPVHFFLAIFFSLSTWI